MRRIKFLFLTRWLPPPFVGGAGRYYYNLLRFMPEDTVIFTEKSRAQGDPQTLNFQYIRRSYIVPSCSPHVPGVIRKLQTFWMMTCWAIELLILCLWQRPECILIGQLHFVGLLGLLMNKILGIPYIIFIFGEELTNASNFRRKMARPVCRNASRIITISDFSVSLIQDIGVVPEHIILARPGINVDTFEVRDAERLTKFRNSLAPNNCRILLTVGRLTKRKGHAKVISVLPEILKIFPQVCYVISGADNGEEKHLRDLISELGLNNRVILLGLVPEENLPLLYNSCDIFILANYELPNKDTEGFGVVFLEASAARKPVIGGQAGGTADAVASGISGLLVDAKNPGALRDAIISLLQDEERASKLGEQGYQRVKSSFSWEHTAAIVSKCLEDVCAHYR